MALFLSWSGASSRLVAEALHAWLPKILPAIRPWISTRDIRVGTRAIPSVENALRECRVGILCITPENQAAPWIHFEAGALARFVALAEYDENQDVVIDENDAIWTQLLLWRDLNHDGISQPSEMRYRGLPSAASVLCG